MVEYRERVVLGVRITTVTDSLESQWRNERRQGAYLECLLAGSGILVVKDYFHEYNIVSKWMARPFFPPLTSCDTGDSAAILGSLEQIEKGIKSGL